MRRCFLTLGLAGCAGLPDGGPSLEQLQQDVEAYGRFPVGHTRTVVSYQPLGTDELRELDVEVWYPADRRSGAPAVYAIAGIVDVPSDVATAEAAASTEGPFPLAIYSHGSGGVGMLAYPTAERLASRGWVVLAPDHRGNTSLDEFFGTPASFVRNLLSRPSDVRALLDAAEVADGLGSRVEGIVGTDDVLVWGHSFGGYTTLVAAGAAVDVDALRAGCTVECELLDVNGVEEALSGGLADPRIDAVIPQAPGVVGLLTEDSLAAIVPPVMLQSGTGDRTTPDETEAQPLWNALAQEEARWVRFQKGGHYSFITMCEDLGVDLIETFSPGASQDGCGELFTPIPEVTPVIGTYVVAWAEAQVRGRGELLQLVDEQPIHPDVVVRLPRAEE